MSVDPAKVATHVELERPDGLVYALIEDRHTHPDPEVDRPHKVLVLQPANGSGEPGGQACLPTRHRLNSPEVERLLRRHPELEPMVTEARLVAPEPAAPPSVADLSRQVAELTALLQDRNAKAPAAAAAAPDDLVRQVADQVVKQLREAPPPAA